MKIENMTKTKHTVLRQNKQDTVFMTPVLISQQETKDRPEELSSRAGLDNVTLYNNGYYSHTDFSCSKDLS